MKKYEYKSIYIRNTNNIDKELNELGSKGWKLIGIRNSSEYSSLHLIRHISKKRELNEKLNNIKKELKDISNR